MPSTESRWRELAGSGGGERGYALALAHAAHDVRVYCAWNRTCRKPGLLVEVPRGLASADLYNLRGRGFAAAHADLHGLPAGHSAYVIELIDDEFRDLFSQMCDDCLDAVSARTDLASSLHALAMCVDRWRRFAQRERHSLSEEEVRGLVGELTILARAVPHYGGLAAVEAWVGPENSLRDFEFADVAVEVKTCEAARGLKVRISDAAQLQTSSSRPLLLTVVRLERVGTGGLTLDMAATRVADCLRAAPDARDLFFSRLATVGYLPPHAALYPVEYAIERVGVYEVRLGFPRLDPSSLPAGIDGVQYSILLAAMEPFRTDALHWRWLGADPA